MSNKDNFENINDCLKKLGEDLKRSEEEEYKTEQDYESYLGKDLFDDLYMFFNPNRIPRGLTDEQAKILAKLSYLRKDYVKNVFNMNIITESKAGETVKSFDHFSLPKEFIEIVYKNEDSGISEEDFKNIIYIFLLQISKL